jgi:A/G-specific adenine glycosylase
MNNVKSIHAAALSWYAANARAFPWRRERDPYRILLSEMMSQQTQISRVIAYYERWLRLFPTLSDLALASKGDVLREWSGLGYNSRALRLHALAKTVVAEYDGKLPRTVAALEELPGIGRYTAHAVVCCAYRKAVPVVDVNIRRIFSRTFFDVHAADEMQSDRDAWTIAARVLPNTKVFQWNQSLMDIGALFCTARSPKCGLCPLSKFCMSAASPSFLLPVKKKRSSEPGFNGIPRRLYRGRILKLLHAGPMSEDDIAQRLWSEFGDGETEWLRHVLGQMEKSSLIARRGKKISVAA